LKSTADIKQAITKWEHLGCPDTVKKYEKLMRNGDGTTARNAAGAGEQTCIRLGSKTKQRSTLDGSPKKRKYVPPGERELSTGPHLPTSSPPSPLCLLSSANNPQSG